MIRALQVAWLRFRRPPAVVIDYSGQETQKPQVHVSVWGHNATQGVYTFDAGPQGDACAELYGRGLANIMGRRLVDNRPALNLQPWQ